MTEDTVASWMEYCLDLDLQNEELSERLRRRDLEHGVMRARLSELDRLYQAERHRTWNCDRERTEQKEELLRGQAGIRACDTITTALTETTRQLKQQQLDSQEELEECSDREAMLIEDREQGLW
jgi:hypothetical protein